MCMIIVKPKGVDFPDKKLFEKAFRNNPDGAGFAYSNSLIRPLSDIDVTAKAEYVRIIKGFMDFDSFYNNILSFKELYEELYKDSPEELINTTFVFHFRKATKGEINPKMTQPFPITHQVDELISTEISTQYAFCHKGTLDLLSSRTKKGRGVSDTYMFVQEYLSLLAMNEECCLERWYNQKLLENLINDKACILKSNGEFKLFGDFYEHNGLLISEKIK